MKVLGKITETLLENTFNSVTYDVIRFVCRSLKDEQFSVKDNNVKIDKDKVLSMMFSSMFSQGLVLNDVNVLVGDVGIQDFCDHWVEFMKTNNDDLRVRASGEFEFMNFKINSVINTLISKQEEVNG
jgi:hypothetical protein